MKKTTAIIITTVGVIGAIIIIWLKLDRDKKKRVIEELSDENIRLLDSHGEALFQLEALRKLVDSNEAIGEEIKSKINALINTYQDIDPKVSVELHSAMVLLESGQTSKAAFSLVKIIENLLKQIYKGNSDFDAYFKKEGKRKNNRNPVFADYLLFAREDGLIQSDELNFAQGLKAMRNKEGHELAVQFDSNWIDSAILMGIGLILKFTGYISMKGLAPLN